MKICPNCNFENFENCNSCEGCAQDISKVKSEHFTIISFLKKNSQIYAIFAIFVGLFRYFITSDDPNVKTISIFPLFIAGYLLLSLVIKGDRIVNTQSYENSISQYINPDSFEFWIFISINILFLLGLFWSAGPNYSIEFVILGAITLMIIIFGRKISSERSKNDFNLLTTSTFFNFIGIFFVEGAIIVILMFSNSLHNLTDPTTVYLFLMIPLVLFFFGIGTLLANVFIGEYMMFAETQRIRENKIKYFLCCNFFI